MKPGVDATIKVPQIADRVFSGKVQRSSVALLTSSRTLTTQVDVPNPDGALRAGLYVYVTLKVPRTEANVLVPAESLVFNQRGTQVAVARDDGTARWRNVRIRRDLGTAVRRVADGDAVFSPRLAGFVLDAFGAAAGEIAEVDEELDRLSAREREVMRLIARGYQYKEVAKELFISVKTVETHASNVLRKTQQSNRNALTRWAANRHIR